MELIGVPVDTFDCERFLIVNIGVNFTFSGCLDKHLLFLKPLCILLVSLSKVHLLGNCELILGPSKIMLIHSLSAIVTHPFTFFFQALAFSGGATNVVLSSSLFLPSSNLVYVLSLIKVALCKDWIL